MKTSKNFSFTIPLYATAHNRVYNYGSVSVECIGTNHAKENAPAILTVDVDAIEAKGISTLQLIKYMEEKQMDAVEFQEWVHDAAQNHVENMWNEGLDFSAIPQVVEIEPLFNDLLNSFKVIEPVPKPCLDSYTATASISPTNLSYYPCS